MSNQIYSNAKDKYFSKPGVNRYSLESQTVVAISTLSGGLNLSKIEHEDFPGMMVMSPTNFKVAEAGMYSIIINLNLLNSITPVSNPLNYIVNLLLNRPDQFNVNVQSVGATIATPASPYDKYANISACLYLTPEDIISVTVKNDSATSSLTIFAATSTLFINRIY